MRGNYELRYERPQKRVRVEFNGALLADSSRAVVLHETRMPAAYYFPLEDVKMELLTKTAHTTHCPFKGEASYWTLKVGDRVAENAAWGYEKPYADAEPLRGYVSFYRDKVSLLDEAGAPAAQTELHGNPIANWLVREGWKASSGAELAQAFLGFLRGAGYPVDRSTIIMPTLHPQ